MPCIHSLLALNTFKTHYWLFINFLIGHKPKILLCTSDNISNKTISMSHPYTTCSLFDRVNDVDASSSVDPNSSPDVILPIYSNLPNDIPFLQLDVDSIQDDNNSDPTYNPLHKRQYSEQLTDEQKVIHLCHYITQCFNAHFSLIGSLALMTLAM